MKEYRTLFLLYMCGLFLLGLGNIAILPPFEGFDENSHYSNIREIATTGTLPSYGSTMLDAMVEDYAANDPMPYGTLKPPFDSNMTYYQFFFHPDKVSDYIRNYRLTPVVPSYKAGSHISWEAIHAPLYYLLLAPVEKITDGFSLVTQILVLRIVSFVMVIAGVALSMRSSSLSKEETLQGFMVYPLIFPMFFAEFGRMGNDSLCMFISAILVLLFTHYREDGCNRRLSLLIGLTLGAGLLTKAFFIPISMGVATWMAVAYLWKSQDSNCRKRHIVNMLIMGASALLTGGLWYIGKLINHIPIVGFEEPHMLEQQGGLITGLEKHFTLHGLIEGFVVNLVTWIWNGTWSIVHILPAMYLPMLVLLFLVLGAFILVLKERPFSDPAWLGVILYCFFGFGFLRHIIISIAISGSGNTPSAYLHILLPWVAPMLGTGVAALKKRHWASIVLKFLVFYAVCFQLSILWSQMALFAGCATKGDDKYYHFPDHGFCLNKMASVMGNLEVLAWPYMALTCFAGGIICFGIVFKSMGKCREQKN